LSKDNNAHSFLQRVCLVTGGGRGIGAAIARAVANEGASVAVNYLSSQQKAEQLVEEIRMMGGRAVAIRADVGNEAEVKKMFELVEQQLGKIDLLVNNAGRSLRALVTETTGEQWDRIMDTNLRGAFLCCRQALLQMIPERYGRIVNIASVWGERGAAYEAVYAASKGGLIALTKSMASEVGLSGITVNAVSPGPVKTAMLIDELDEDEIKSLEDEIPAGRLGESEEIASACVFLLSNRASYINGQVLTVDGGWKL